MALDADEICGADLEEEDQPAGAFQPDLRPEFCQYRDEGCEFARSCLECPYMRCLYDEPVYKRSKYKKLRDKQISRLFKSGRDIDELADIFRLSARTIFRITRGKTVNKEAHKRRGGFKE